MVRILTHALQCIGRSVYKDFFRNFQNKSRDVRPAKAGRSGRITSQRLGLRFFGSNGTFQENTRAGRWDYQGPASLPTPAGLTS